jgi:predicted nucleic acid-binding protein
LIVLDTSFLYGLLDRRDRRHAEAAAWYRSVDDDLATTPLVLAEVDYLARRAGPALRDAFRRDITSGAYLVGWWDAALTSLAGIAERYADLGVSLTDASLVALAERLETTQIATFDERHFRAMLPLTGEPAFTLLPLDAP